jgi:hypothetical protein
VVVFKFCSGRSLRERPNTGRGLIDDAPSDDGRTMAMSLIMSATMAVRIVGEHDEVGELAGCN